MNNLPIQATELIPHRGRMCLIDALTVYSEDEGRARATIDASHLFLVQNDELDSVVLTELIAQTAAAHSGYKALSEEGIPMFGFLVGIKDLRILGTARKGDRLTIQIYRDFKMEQVTFLTGKVLCGTTLLAEGILKLYEMPANQVEANVEIAPQGKITPFSGWTKKQQSLTSANELNREILRFCRAFQYEENEVSAEFSFGQTFAGFNGHFPENPIVPGVMLLKTGQLIAELAAEKSRPLRLIHSAKFAKTVLPGERVRFSVQAKESRVKIQVKAQDTLCAKFSFTLE
jgi:3-hydroxyacyl-[acyl-carrier-protein] dehydratase